MEKRAELYVDESNGDPTDPGVGSSNDEDLRDVFESLLNARRLANAGVELGYTAAMLALTKASCPVRELATWAAKSTGLICTPEEYERLSARQRRSLITGALQFQLQILQPQARVELAQALVALDIGETVGLWNRRRPADGEHLRQTSF
jgi:hypothetical protein